MPNWQTGDTLIAAGNVRYRVISVIPEELVGEFILDGPDVGVIEVEPLYCRVASAMIVTSVCQPELVVQNFTVP